MNTTAILGSFLNRLDSFSELPIAWPGMPKTPPSTGMWLEALFFPNEGRDLAWDNDSQQDTLGFFQLSVYYRPGKGANQVSQIAAMEIADAIIYYFPKGFPVGDVKVRKEPWQGPAVNLKGKSFIPITIPYRGIVSTGGYPYKVSDGGIFVFDDGIQVITL